MTLTLKSRQQIEYMRQAGAIVAETFEILGKHIRPGVTTAELDAIAEEYIRSRGAEPVYKGYRGARGRGRQAARQPFPGTICASINDAHLPWHSQPASTLTPG